MRKEFFNKTNLSQDIYMINCGYEDCCVNFYRVPHYRGYYLLHYVTKGNGYYEVNGQRHEIETGDLFLIKPNELVCYASPDINNTWSFCWIGFSGQNADFYAHECGLSSGQYVYSLRSNSFSSIISNCLNYLDSIQGEPSQLRLTSYLMQALSILENKSRHAPVKTTPADLVDCAVRYIEYNYMNKITIEGIADYLSIDRSYFYRIFKNATGGSPEHYIICYRIQKATEFLKTSTYSITEIATFVGIPDVYHFSKTFKNVVGISPSQYRNL